MSEKMTERDIGPYPYVGKTIAEVIHDYAVTRGDLVEQYARAQLVDIIERRIAQARREGAAEVTARVEAVLDQRRDELIYPTTSNTSEGTMLVGVAAVRAALRGQR